MYGTLALVGSAYPPPYYLDPSLVAAHLTCQSLSSSVLEWTSKCVEYRADAEVCEKWAAFHIPGKAPKTFFGIRTLGIKAAVNKVEMRMLLAKGGGRGNRLLQAVTIGILE